MRPRQGEDRDGRTTTRETPISLLLGFYYFYYMRSGIIGDEFLFVFSSDESLLLCFKKW